MKKRIFPAVLSLAAALLFAGCAQSIANSTDKDTASHTETFADSFNGAKAKKDMPPAESGRENSAPTQNQSGVFGKVTAVSDSEITVALAQMPQMQSGAKPDGTLPQEKDGKSAKPEGTPPSGASGEKPADMSRPDMQGGFEVTLTGESAAYALDANVTVSSMRGGEALALSDVTVDSIVRLTVETDSAGNASVTQIQLQ